MSFRIGFGYDVHPFEEGRELMLGGVRIDSKKGLKGHSDADVLLHSITDALLGSLGLGDIGTHFPDTDPTFKECDSSLMLQRSYQMITDQGYILVNADVTVVAESPKLNPYTNRIRKRVSEILNCSETQISIKATTSEKMGFVGREEGIAVHSIVLIEKKG